MGRAAVLRTAIIVFLVSSVGVAGAFWWGHARYTGSGPLAAGTAVVIPKGTGVEGVAELLARAGVIANPLVFRLAVRLEGNDRLLRAGEYAFTPRISMREAAALIVGGRTVIRRLTIAEGLSSAQVLELVSGATGLAGPTEGIAAAEGALLPETYFYSWGDERAALVARMKQAMQNALSALWARRADGLAVRTPQEALTLASIIEKETAIAEERPRVSAVFHNRLRRGMRLQSDPTVVYALTRGAGPLERALSRADLDAVSPYNTYVVRGLPPGPIANPGRAAIEAALNPADGGDLYFVADGNGGHVFARTLAEHNRNVARWRRLKRATRNPDPQGSPRPPE